VLAAAGCATKTAGGAQGGASSAGTINFYGNALGEAAQKAAWESVVKGWETKSGAHVKPVVYPYDQAATQLALAAKSGKFAGVGMGPWQVLVPTGILADVSDLLDGMDLPAEMIDSFRVDGKLYVLPTTSSGIGMVTDGRIATEAGLKPGLSTDEFATVLETIKKQDPKIIPYAGVTKSDLKDAVHWMWGWGSEVVSADRQCTIGDAESVAAITWYQGLLSAGLIKSGVSRPDARILFARGQTAIYDDAPLANTFVSTNGGSKELQSSLTAVARPQYGGKPSYNRWWGGGLFCSAGEGEKTSKDFMKYVATDVSAATTLYKQSAVAPADKRVAAQIPDLAKDAFQNGFRTNVSEHARPAAWDTLATGAEIDTTISESVAGILAGQTTVQNGLNALRTTIQKLLDTK
jgi:multiple sugar transport system substrate-binding protein